MHLATPNSIGVEDHIDLVLRAAVSLGCSVEHAATLSSEMNIAYWCRLPSSLRQVSKPPGLRTAHADMKLRILTQIADTNVEPDRGGSAME